MRIAPLQAFRVLDELDANQNQPQQASAFSVVHPSGSHASLSTTTSSSSSSLSLSISQSSTSSSSQVSFSTTEATVPNTGGIVEPRPQLGSALFAFNQFLNVYPIQVPPAAAQTVTAADPGPAASQRSVPVTPSTMMERSPFEPGFANVFGFPIMKTFSDTTLAAATGPMRKSNEPSKSVSPQPSGSSRKERSLPAGIREITTVDDPAELDAFCAQGDEACIHEMKLFIEQFHLRQTTVAMMTGVSQPYISKLLNGNYRELSVRCRRSIYSWYLNCRRHPEKLAPFSSDPSIRLETDEEGQLLPQRRERHVFRNVATKVLETYFEKMPFPDADQRTEIAAACNRALQMEKQGQPLLPKEMVSPQIIANWFANRRKEHRRKKSGEPQEASVGSVVQPSGSGS
ncbi:homeobox domain-containing protein [Aphelenchoides avenae]|nr:homeobox domain-containing protein [Aphelenchus avenae]